MFFDWDKTELTDRARQIISEAATNSTKVQYTRIEVNGYTDTSGTPKYNQGLSVRRAQGERQHDRTAGMPTSEHPEGMAGCKPVEVHLAAPGSTRQPSKRLNRQPDGLDRLLGQQVREPQNRRVEIIIR